MKKLQLIIPILVFSLSPVYSESEIFKNKTRDLSPMTLDICSSVSIAVSNSYDLGEIRAKENLYLLAIDEKLRSYFPSLTFSYMQTDEVVKRDSDNRLAKFSVATEFLIYDGGKRNIDYSIARLNALLSRNDYRITLNKLIVSIREHYLNLLKLREMIKIYTMTLEQGRLQHKFILKEFELGDATKLSVIEIEAKVKEIELSLRQAIDEYELTLNKFKLLLRINRHTPVELKGDLEKDFVFVGVEKLDIEELVSIALKMRKEVESAYAKYEISVRNNEINEKYFLPDVSVGLNYDLSGENYPPREKGWGINLKLSSRILGNTVSGGGGYGEGGNGYNRTRSGNTVFDVMNNMKYKSTLVESRIDMARSGDELKVLKESIAVEITSYCSVLKNSWDMIQITSRQVELYDSQLAIERLKAEMGESRRYDLLEKEMDRSKAAVSMLNAKIKYLSAASALELSAGMDVDFFRKYIKSKK